MSSCHNGERKKGLFGMCHEVSASHVVAAAAADNIRENNIDTINKDNFFARGCLERKHEHNYPTRLSPTRANRLNVQIVTEM